MFYKLTFLQNLSYLRIILQVGIVEAVVLIDIFVTKGL